MKWTSRKNLNFTKNQKKKLIFQNLFHFFIKFFPSSSIVVIIYAISMTSSCTSLHNQLSTNITSNITINCYPHLVANFSAENLSDDVIKILRDYLDVSLRKCRQIASFALVTYWCAISSGFVHKWKLMIKKPPTTNRVWMTSVVVTIILQIVYAALNLAVDEESFCLVSGFCLKSFSIFQMNWGIIFGIIWILPCLLINEIYKIHEISDFNRNERRSRLNFGTKLGMNSPF